MKLALLAALTLAFAVPVLADQEPAVGTDSGFFHADCEFSHRAQVDPIVSPGRASAHMHDFFGNGSTAANSTNFTLRRASRTCVRTDTPFGDLDRSAYWVPTLYQDDQPVTPAEPMGAYYSTGRRALNIEPFPEDLRIIAGSSKGGQQEVNGQRVFFWSCPAGTIEKGTATVAPRCASERLDLDIRFPDCWDGINTDSPDHQSHMAYSRQTDGVWVCPASHPVQVPRLKINFRYPTSGGPSVRLSSGPMNTAHADFMNGWDPDKLAGLVDRCLRADRYCGGGDVPDK